MTVRVLLITDRRLMAAHHGDFRAALAAALPYHRGHSRRSEVSLLIRDKDAAPIERRALINIACDVLPDDVPLLVSGHLPDDLAPPVLARIAGLHAPEAIALAPMLRVLKTWARPALLGCSRHSVAGVVEAASAGVSYVQFGPVWATPSKRGMGEPLGLEAVQQARAALQQAGASTRLIAVGGIVDGSFAVLARAAGADGVAVIRGVWSSTSPADQLGHILQAVRPAT
ncbi:MAG: thiamine phosphate synthase [Kofleriaceae bacterium]|nr:thiamine phosphate synthase [Kofleriaceae bacterium]